jgi:hypothetical protein
MSAGVVFGALNSLMQQVGGWTLPQTPGVNGFGPMFSLAVFDFWSALCKARWFQLLFCSFYVW